MGVHFCLSRCDYLGDSVLALPVAGALKARYPDCRVTYLSRKMNTPLLRHSRFVDDTLAIEDILYEGEQACGRHLTGAGIDTLLNLHSPVELIRAARTVRIRKNVGNWRRRAERRYCNRGVWLPRRQSGMHEARRNLRFLRAVGIYRHYALADIPALYGLDPATLPASPLAERPRERYRVILHPKSRSKAREWPPEYFAQLVDALDPSSFEVVFTGSAEERALLGELLPFDRPHVVDLMGATDGLEALAAVIADSDALFAASTGPLHLAAALGCTAIGVYVPYFTMGAECWAPLGRDTHVFQRSGRCKDCPGQATCGCIRAISCAEVSDYLQQRAAERGRGDIQPWTAATYRAPSTA